MGYLHPNAPLVVDTLDGWSDFTIYQQRGQPAGSGLPWRMRDGRLLRMRSGGRTDGLSSPKFSKCYLQSTNSFFPTVSHDAWYRGFIDESLDGGVTWTPWAPEKYVKAEADAALRELTEDNFVPPAEINTLVMAVQEFGQAAWDADAASRPDVATRMRN